MEQLRPPTAVDMRPPTWASTGRKSTDSSSSAASNATTVIIVVNVLPLAFERKADDSGWDVTWSSTATGMFYRNLLSDVDAQYAPLYIGCPEVFVARDEELAVEKQLRAFHCVPVYLDPVVGHRYFQGFCKGVLWPVFHNVVDVYNSAQLALDDVPREETHASRGVHRRNSNSTRADKKPQAWCDPASWNPGAQDKCWGDYCSVNRTFSRRVIESYHTGNIIWIQDFHFLMLPSYLLRKLRTALIAVYLHVPFPSSEVFRCLAMRTEILRAMLCADHLGFLVFEHARHFLTSCKRLLGLNYRTSHNGMLVLEYNGRKICISCSHVEPDVSHIYSMVSRLETDSGSLAFRDEIEQCLYSQNNERKFVFASVDRLEGLCALPLKLRAFDRFLATHPAKRKSVVLIQIGLSLDCRPNDYNQTREYVLKFVEEINARWAPPGESVVVFKERRRTSCMERLHLWRICDAYMDTCVRSGLSLLPFEYIIAQERVHETPTTSDSSRHFGAMIVSEFASYSRILNGSLLVNPWRTDDIVNALVKATEMNYYEKHSRYALNHSFLESKSEKKWAERMLSDFEASVTKKQQSEAGETVAVGFGFDYRVMQFESGFVHLDVDEVVKACSKSSRRLFMFDYGGTLSRTANILEEEVGVAPRMHRNGSVESSMECADLGDCHSHLAYDEVIRFIDGKVRTPLSTETRDNICTLCNDPQNVVFILSTGQRAELDAAFADVPNLNLVADSGFFFKKARSSKWECLYADGELDFDWMDEAKLIIQAYASRTNGAYLVVSEVSLLYDYRNSDPEYGEIQALELYEQLRQMAKVQSAFFFFLLAVIAHLIRVFSLCLAWSSYGHSSQRLCGDPPIRCQ